MGKSDWRELFGVLSAEGDHAAADEARNEIRRYVYLLTAVADLKQFGLIPEDDSGALVDDVLEAIESPVTLAALEETRSPHASVMRIIRERAYGLARRLGRRIPSGADPRASRTSVEMLLESLSDEEVEVYLLCVGGRSPHDVATDLGLPYWRVLQGLMRVNHLIQELFSQPS